MVRYNNNNFKMSSAVILHDNFPHNSIFNVNNLNSPLTGKADDSARKGPVGIHQWPSSTKVLLNVLGSETVKDN